MRNAAGCQLEELAERVRAIEQAGHASGGVCAARVSTGWPAVDAVLDGGLAVGAVHEWFLNQPAGAGDASHHWHPPLALLMHLVRQAMWASDQGRWSIWIGQHCWPHPHGLAGEGNALLKRALFVDPPDEAGRLWAIDVAARCNGVAVVVADGSGFDMAATRRLQLAAETGGTLVLLTRPMRQYAMLSAATTRWGVTPAVSDTDRPRWHVELWRCKGVQRQTGREAVNTWLVEGVPGRERGLVITSAEPCDRSAASQTSASQVEGKRKRA